MASGRIQDASGHFAMTTTCQTGECLLITLNALEAAHAMGYMLQARPHPITSASNTFESTQCGRQHKNLMLTTCLLMRLPPPPPLPLPNHHLVVCSMLSQCKVPETACLLLRLPPPPPPSPQPPPCCVQHALAVQGPRNSLFTAETTPPPTTTLLCAACSRSARSQKQPVYC